MVKNLSANAGGTRDSGLIPGLGLFPGVENGNPFQYSCAEISTDRGAWWAIVHGVAKSRIRLSDFHFHFEEGTKALWLQIPNGKGNDLEGTCTVRKVGLRTLSTP